MTSRIAFSLTDAQLVTLATYGWLSWPPAPRILKALQQKGLVTPYAPHYLTDAGIECCRLARLLVKASPALDQQARAATAPPPVSSPSHAPAA